MNLKKIRKERGFSQRYMADQLKIGISTYNQYENSNRKKIADIKDAMLVAVLTNDTELQEELKQEYASVIEDTNNKLKDVIFVLKSLMNKVNVQMKNVPIV